MSATSVPALSLANIDGVTCAVSVNEGVDSLGIPFASVSVSDGPTGSYSVTHSSFERGGCLYAGTVIVRNWRTGAAKEIDVTSRASGSAGHVGYLLGLAAKHVG